MMTMFEDKVALVAVSTNALVTIHVNSQVAGGVRQAVACLEAAVARAVHGRSSEMTSSVREPLEA